MVEVAGMAGKASHLGRRMTQQINEQSEIESATRSAITA